MKKIWYFIFPTVVLLLVIFVIFSAFNRKDKSDLSFFNDDAEEEILPPPFLVLENTDWADSVLANMSLDEKIGQLFMVAAYSNRPESHRQEITRLVKDYHIGGLIMMQGGPVRTAKLTNYYQSQAKTPLLVSIDGEWGLAMRLDSTISFPRQMALGAIRNDSLIYNMGAEIARQSKRIGIQVNFAPVVDVNNNPRNPVIGSRAFGENKEEVALKGIAYMKGMQDNLVLASAKHFPGHGDTDSDSHKTLPVIKHNTRRLDSIELYPFKRLIRSGLGSMMVAHLYIPALDSTPNQASTLSAKIVDTLLRQELDFKGLIFTDALNMKGVSAYFRPGELDLKAFLAGNDVLLFAEDVPAASVLIRTAVEKNLVPINELDRRVRKILLTKQWAGLHKFKPVPISGIHGDLNNRQAIVLNRQLMQASLTATHNRNNLLPLSRLDTLRIATVNIGNKSQDEFQKTVANYTKADFFGLDEKSTSAERDTLLQRLRSYNLILVNLTGTNQFASRKYGLGNQAPAFISALAAMNQKFILHLPGNPYLLEFLPGAERSEGVVLSYDDNSFTRSIGAQAIFGGVAVNGKLPVSVGRAFPAGAGVDLKKNRLGYLDPEDLGMNSGSLKEIDSIMEKGIRDQAMPGGQVLIAKKGFVVFNKSYGYHTYGKTNPVDWNDLYDIASLTKITGTLPALMKLATEGDFTVDQILGKYLPETRGSNKEDLVIREILAHQAGLKSWIPFYVSTLDKGVYRPGIYSTAHSAEYPYQVGDQLYIHQSWRDTLFNRILRSEVKKPGEYVYSDLGYYLLQRVVERLKQMPLNEYMEKEFYSKIGMNYTTYRPREKFDKDEIVPTEHDKIFRKQVVHGFVHDQGAAMMGGVAGHAGLFSNANDLAKMMQMYLQDGSYGGIEFVSGDVIKNFTEQQYCENQNRRGVGFDRPEPGSGGPVCTAASMLSFGHSGFTGTLAWADPETDLIYIFLSNRVYPDAENRKLISMDIRTKVQDVIYKADTKALSSSSLFEN